VTKFELPLASSSSIGPKIGGKVSSADWSLSSKVVNTAGKVFPRLSSGFGFARSGNGAVTFVGAGRCPNKIPSSFGSGGGNSGPSKAVQEALAKCVNSFHLTQYLTYQPASRFWMFQWCELGSYVVLAGLLAWFSVWWIRRR
jgi:hypothetical protein